MSTGYSVDIEINPNNGLGQIVQTYYPAFGGDTFINAFALKRKHAFFRQNLAAQRTLASLTVNSQSSRTLLGNALICNSLTLTSGKLGLNGQSLTSMDSTLQLKT